LELSGANGQGGRSRHAGQRDGETRDGRDTIDREVDGGRTAVLVPNHLVHRPLDHVIWGAEEDAEILEGPVVARANHQQGASVG
jgi:hypothetical protein